MIRYFVLVMVLACGGRVSAAEAFDIAPFALPNCAPGEVRFEEPRDISRVVVTFEKKPTGNVSVSYLRKYWADSVIELALAETDSSMGFGWCPIDDWFNSQWKKAEISTVARGSTCEMAFKPLTSEFPSCAAYDVSFRRTLGVKIETEDKARVSKIQVYTVSKPVSTSLRVELDAGSPTPGAHIRLSGYNAIIGKLTLVSGTSVKGNRIELKTGKRVFAVDVRHLSPAREFAYDTGMVTFELEKDAFTISLDDLTRQGPVWYPEQGVYVTRAEDTTTFDQYKAKAAKQATIGDRVKSLPEQSLGGATNGQPRPHPEAFFAACRHARQRFRIEPNGDIVLTRMSMDLVAGKDSPRYSNDGNGRMLFGLEKWICTGRFGDPLSIPVYNTRFARGGMAVEQKTLAVPLLKQVSDDLVGDDSIIGLVRFRFRNDGGRAAVAELPLNYCSRSDMTRNRYLVGGISGGTADGDLVPTRENEKLSIVRDPSNPSMLLLRSAYKDQEVLRCVVDTSMQCEKAGNGTVLRKELAPGETCDVLVKVPYIALDTPEELAALAKLSFEPAYAQVREFWHKELAKGTQIKTAEPRLDAFHSGHLAHVLVSDFSMPNDPDLINTSVATSWYPNYSNESCMIVHELDERGMHEEARRRLAVWLKYQGTVGLKGDFSDHDGVFFGAGGFECGDSYDQHHGWVLWCLAEHYFMTRDDAWLASAAGNLIQGVDWVFRQRKRTMTILPHSRGWEYGFLPAGSLEDVSDYFYWLSTNAITWRGVDSVAQALEEANHPEAARVRKEADTYRADLIRGFEKMRQHTPLVRLKDGRWVGNYASRLYLRGRDVGWIREILEGSVYLLISGLYDANSPQGKAILDDFQDNRYMNPVYGYRVFKANDSWFDFGGFCYQPNLLAGLLPYLDRDEPEVYDWMFFNAFAACYKEEVNAIAEHPMPLLGYSNAAIPKTSDESNSAAWLRYMYVYVSGNNLYFGRALPRKWMTDGNEIYAEKASTRFGDVSVRYRSETDQGKITMTADLPAGRQPARIVGRIRHPGNLPIKSVSINGETYTKFDPSKGDVDLTGLSGRVVVEARY